MNYRVVEFQEASTLNIARDGYRNEGCNDMPKDCTFLIEPGALTSELPTGPCSHHKLSHRTLATEGHLGGSVG